jgi:hypothetical protein
MRVRNVPIFKRFALKKKEEEKKWGFRCVLKPREVYDEFA